MERAIKNSIALMAGLILAILVGICAMESQADPLPGEYQTCPIAQPFRPLNCPNGYTECICTADGCSWVWRNCG